MNDNRRTSGSRRKKWADCFSIIVLSGLLLVARGASADPVLDVVIGGDARQFGRDALLGRPDVAGVEIANDVAYGKAMS
jgi:hypothetical protein